jgi:tetratricopeptide (TPR) repeat protein
MKGQPESPRSFKQRMIHKLGEETSIFPELDLSETTSSIFSQLWDHKKQSLTEPDYCKSKTNSFSFQKDSIALHLLLGKKLYKFIEQSLVSLSPTSEEDHFNLFKYHLYRWELDLALECISKCVIINPKKYQKWKSLTMFHMNTLNMSEVKNTRDWEKEAELLKVFQNPTESKASELFEKDDFFGSLAWIHLFSMSCHPDKDMIILNICKKLIDKFPQLADCYLITLSHLLRKDLSQASELCDSIFERLKSNIPEDFKVFLKLTSSKIMFLQGKTNQSLDYLKDSYMQHPTYSRILYYFGKFCVNSNRQNISHYAIGALKAYLKYDNIHNAKAQLLLVRTYYFRNQIFKAAKTCKKLSISDFSKKNLKTLQNISESLSHEIAFLSHSDKSGNMNQDFVLHAEVTRLIRSKETTEALKKLRTLQLRQETEMNYYMNEVKILGSVSDPAYLNKNNELLKKITGSKVSPDQWEKTILFYAKNTVGLESFEDAIKILTCIGFIYPDLPLELFFLSQKTVSRQNSGIIIKPPDDTEELTGRRKAEQMVVTFSEMVSSPKQRRYSSQIPRPNYFKGANQVRDSCFLNPDNNVKSLEKLPTTSSSLFVCTFPVHLYKIGKISALYKVKEFEGILALKDFILILNSFQFKMKIKQKFIPRAQFYLSALVLMTNQESSYEDLLSDTKERPEFESLIKKHSSLSSLFN